MVTSVTVISSVLVAYGETNYPANVTGYSLTARPKDGGTALVVVTSTPPLTVSGLKPGMTYTVYITAVTDQGYSLPSPGVDVTW